MFLTRAHAMGWETETLSYREAQALSQRRREAGKGISARSKLEEVRDRDRRVQRQQRQKPESVAKAVPMSHPPLPPKVDETLPVAPTPEAEVGVEREKKPVPYVRVLDYEEMKWKGRLL